MRLLDPGQARAVILLMQNIIMHSSLGGDEYTTVQDNIEKMALHLTAKPWDEEWCKGCQHYGHDESLEWYEHGGDLWCRHIDGKPGYCPEGRWEDK